MKSRFLKRLLPIALMIILVLSLLPVFNQTPVAAASKPLSQGQQNIIKRARQMTNIAWTPLKNISSWNGASTFYAGTTYYGLPYGQPAYGGAAGRYIPWAASLDTFAAAVKNVNSSMYTTRGYIKYSSYIYFPYYSNDCSAFVSSALNMPSRKTTATITGSNCYSISFGYYNYNNIEVGDFFNSNSIGHVVLVTDVTLDSSGNVNGVEISEQTPPICKITRYGSGGSLSLYDLAYKYRNYGLYRYSLRDSVTYTHSCAIPLEGDSCSSCGTGEPTTPTTIADGAYTISPAGSGDYKVDLASYSTDNGIETTLWATSHEFNQKYVFQKVEGKDYYTIRNLYSNKYLEIMNMGADGEYKVKQCSYTGADCQMWYLYDAGSGYYFMKNKATGLYVDLANGTLANGTEIRNWEFNGSIAQKWALSPTETLLDGVYTVRCSADTSLGWMIKDGSRDNLAQLVVGTTEQKFVITHEADNYYNIRVLDSGKMIDVDKASADPDVTLQQYDNLSNDAQKWLIMPNADGTYTFVSKCAWLNIDWENGTGERLRTWYGNTAPAQKWVLNLQSVVDDGTYFIGSKLNPAYRLNVSGASTETSAAVVLGAADGRAHQQWKFEKQGDGTYCITNVNSGKKLDACEGGRMPGTLLSQSNGDGTSQKFSIVPNTDGSFSIVSAHNRFYVDLANGTLENGTTISCWWVNHSSAQKWVLHKAGNALANGDYTIAFAKNNGYMMTVSNNGKENSTPIVLWSKNSGENQKFRFTALGGGVYKIMSLSSGKYLENAGGGMSNGTILWQYASVDGDGQKWLILQNTDNSWGIFSVESGLAIDLSSGVVENGRTIQLWSYDLTSVNQKWTISSTTHTHNYTEKVVHPTQSAPGYVLHACGCGDSFTSDTVRPDKTVPTISATTTSDISSKGFTVSFKVTDNYMVGEVLVKIRIGTNTNYSSVSYTATEKNGVYTVKVLTADHNLSTGKYTVDIIATDMSGNKKITSVEVDVPAIDDGMVQSGKIVAGVFSFVNMANGNFAIGVNGESLNSGARTSMTARVADKYSQLWNITPAGNGYYEIGNIRSFMYLATENSGTAGGTNVVQETYTGSDSQLWKAVENSDGTYSFINKASGHALDMTGAGQPKEGTNIQICAINSTSAQRWYLVKYAALEEGTYRIAGRDNINMNIEVGNSDTTDGANVQVWENNGANCTKWVFTVDDNCLYTITNLHSGKVMEAANEGTAAGTNVQQNTSNGKLSQKWIAIPNKDGSFSFFNAHNGLALDLSGGGAPTMGQNIQCWTYNGANPQKWFIVGRKAIAEGEYTIACYDDTGMLVEVKGAEASNNGGNVQVWEANGAAVQRWKFTYDASDGYYRLTNCYSGKAMDMASGGTTPGTNVIQHDANNDYNGWHQKWFVIKNGDGSYSLIGALNTLALDLSEGGTPYMGQNIQLWTYTGLTPQKWIIK